MTAKEAASGFEMAGQDLQKSPADFVFRCVFAGKACVHVNFWTKNRLQNLAISLVN